MQQYTQTVVRKSLYVAFFAMIAIGNIVNYVIETIILLPLLLVECIGVRLDSRRVFREMMISVLVRQKSLKQGHRMRGNRLRSCLAGSGCKPEVLERGPRREKVGSGRVVRADMHDTRADRVIRIRCRSSSTASATRYTNYTGGGAIRVLTVVTRRSSAYAWR